MKRLRVAHLSTSASGGAGIAALRLSNVLSDTGLSSRVLHAEKRANGLIAKVSSKVLTGIQQANTRGEYGVVTPFSGSKISRENLLREFDVLHIHNWYNLMSLSDFEFLSTRIPLVFTLHDERLMTGGCHMTLGCEAFTKQCQHCPAITLGTAAISHAKNALSGTIAKVDKLSVITPSKWMGNQWNSAYPMLKDKLNFIPNIIEYPDNLSRQKATTDTFKIFFASARLDTPVKGLDLLLSAISLGKFHKRVQLNLAGAVDGKVQRSGIEIKVLGQLTSNEVYKEMVEADLLVVPSKSENSPNIIAEAQLLGVPVLASCVGGITELIKHGETGYLAETTAESFATQISLLVNGSISESVIKNAKIEAMERWDNIENAHKHIAIYKGLL